MEISRSGVMVVLRTLFRRQGLKGSCVKEFEDQFAQYIGVPYAVAFSSARAGLYFVLEALSCQAGDEVLVPAYTFFSVPVVVILAGLKPVFVDADPKTYNIDTSRIEEMITRKTKAVIVSHLHGQPARMDGIMELAERYNLRVIEDCAHSCGAEYDGRKTGSFDIGCFSFGLGKNLSIIGGGMVTTSDRELVEKIRGIKKEFLDADRKELAVTVLKGIGARVLTYPPIFTCSVFPVLFLSNLFHLRFFSGGHPPPMPAQIPDAWKRNMSDVQAALGIEQLRRLDAHNQKMIENAQILTEELRGVDALDLPAAPPSGKGIFFHYAVQVEDRETFIRRLVLKGVDAQKDYCSSCPDLDLSREYRSDCPVASYLSRTTAYLPNHPSLNKEDMVAIARKVKTILGGA